MTGIVIGRFQVPYLHAGHVHLITTALRTCDKVAVFLACKLEDVEGKNPYTIAHRTKIIKQLFPQVEVITLWDRESNIEWSRIVDAESFAVAGILQFVPDMILPNIIGLFHSRDSFAKHYTGRIPLVKVGEIEGYSGTKLRAETQNKKL